jgi:hypothetical protein
LAEARQSKGVILSEPGSLREKEEGETALGLDGEKVLSPEMIRRRHSESEREIQERQMQQQKNCRPESRVGNILATRKLLNHNLFISNQRSEQIAGNIAGYV